VVAHVRVSVVVATIGDDDAIRERVRDLARSQYPADLLDVVIALDARRTPATVSVPVGDLRVCIVRGDAPGGKAMALNAGVRAATGDVLVFTDLAQRFEPETIPRLVAALAADQRLGAVSGALQLGEASGRFSVANLYWRMERQLRGNEARIHSAVGVTGAVYAMRRGLWAPLPEGLILDDLYAPMQLVLRGYRVGLEERARAHDARHFAPEEEYRRKARTLTGVLQLCAWLPAVLSPTRNPIWLQFVSHKLLRLATPYLLLAATAVAVWRLLGVKPFGLPTWTWGAALVVALAPVGLSRRLREAAMGALYMQAALVKAATNALRGEWDVWQH
jgi:cellulose synthase/poly-beta-1,6-N-acetylglucosamine synthase-like glycosyltransferase